MAIISYTSYPDYGRQQVHFQQLDTHTQIEFTRSEFVRLAKSVFESPEILKQWFLEKKITAQQAKNILQSIDNLSSNKQCFCCKRFDQYKLKLTPIDVDLECLLDIAKQIVEAKLY